MKKELRILIPKLFALRRRLSGSLQNLLFFIARSVSVYPHDSRFSIKKNPPPLIRSEGLYGADERTRTFTPEHKNLNLACLPVPPRPLNKKRNHCDSLSNGDPPGLEPGLPP